MEAEAFGRPMATFAWVQLMDTEQIKHLHTTERFAKEGGPSSLNDAPLTETSATVS
jgi:hypothetical protein